ncbi:DUF433 domain-containing protein [Crocosphaera chwakensis]|uniref:DUF433 domain-containing protein n=1 Tax=Crocosphaera chwakensis CCY0110 TaxID=391612 RepID=A3J037_9CHRO|nr:hypothetical protein [Crocosphaera chwakensis]EAZ87910.1 hypothetical protein CY0110_01215 [Crocosphaera chwakensis CCY0110]
MTNQPIKTQWQYLETRSDSWRKQLYIKGTRIKASVIYSDMIVNEMTEADAVYNWDLPLKAIQEVIEYCQTHQELLNDDFLKLHKKTSLHPGILVICQDDDSAKDMSYKSIVKAIANLEVASIPLTNQFISLNHWNY